MTKDQQRDDYSDYSAAIEELRHLAREPFETPRELLRLRQRIATERERSHRRILETVAQQAHVDLQSILDEARRRNAVKRRYVTKTLTRLEAEASERAAGARPPDSDAVHRNLQRSAGSAGRED